LVLNENHREITHFHDKSIAEFVEMKLASCKALDKENAGLAEGLLDLIEKTESI
jgi:hypothetical protein